MEKKSINGVNCFIPDNNQTVSANLETSEPTNYTENKELLDKAQELDETDQFGQLLIDTKEYIRKDHKVKRGNTEKTVRFGIGFDRLIHYSNQEDDPIYDHQRNAAKRFLKDFRGVGILADEVGMGKTIEAGIIMSELAERRLVSSVLIITASDENLVNWINELGSKFGIFLPKEGMTKDESDNIMDENDKLKIYYDALIVKTANDISLNTEKNRPMQPMLITMKDFRDINIDKIKNIVFDLVIVDEAHNFDATPEGIRGMNNLKALMEIKRKKGKPYCILLSGTPHKGNLDSMFPLWYFMKGSSFPTEEAAKKHYKQYLCNNASTISEFIESYKEENLNNCEEYIKFRANYIEEKLSKFKNLSKTEIEIKRKSLLENDIASRNDFLAIKLRDNDLKYYNDIKAKVCNAYYGLIDSFMIRQSRELYGSSSRDAYNYYFAPTFEKSLIDAEFVIPNTVNFREDNLKIKIKKYNLYEKDSIECKGKLYSIDSFVRDYSTSKNEIEIDTDKRYIIINLLSDQNIFYSDCKTITNSGEESSKTVEFSRLDGDYYRNTLLGTIEDKTHTYIRPFYSGNEELDTVEEKYFYNKAELFCEIINTKIKKGDKVIVFFDYETGNQSKEALKLYEYLKKYDKNIYDQVAYGETSDILKKQFETSKNILFADKELSESANLQFAHIIINFSLSKSPILMDQKLGRIDRIGQKENMLIFNMARMDLLEGYILAFYNSIRLFSGWKNDIILVTGCDNKNTVIKQCSECGKIYRDIDNTMTNCETCGGVLNTLKNTRNYECTHQSCGFRLNRRYYQITTPSQLSNKAPKKFSFIYFCSYNEKLEFILKENKITCPKWCVVSKCKRAKDNCLLVKELKNPDSKLSKTHEMEAMNEICNKCKSTGNKCICEACDTRIDVCGNVNGNGIRADIAIPSLNCGMCGSKPNCFYMIDLKMPTCPICKNSGRGNVPLKEIIPATFDEFAEYVWRDKETDFIKSFSSEANKISDIVRILEMKR